jgi:hypothetical protein
VHERPELAHLRFASRDPELGIGFPGTLPAVAVLIENPGDDVVTSGEWPEREAATGIGHSAVG